MISSVIATHVCWERCLSLADLFCSFGMVASGGFEGDVAIVRFISRSFSIPSWILMSVMGSLVCPASLLSSRVPLPYSGSAMIIRLLKEGVRRRWLMYIGSSLLAFIFESSHDGYQLLRENSKLVDKTKASQQRGPR